MLFDLGLLTTIALGAWMSLDLLFAEGWRRRSLSIGVLGLTGAIWAGGELLLRGFDSPTDLALLRRVLYFGGWGVTLAWLWVSVQAAAPAWYRKRPWILGLAALPAAGFYSTHFWANGLTTDVYAPTPKHGPLFPFSVGYAWVLTAVGMFYFASAAYQLRRAPVRAVALLAGVAVPLVASVLYTAGYTGTVDPAPALLGFAAIMIRYAVVETGLAMYLPLARSDVIEQLKVGIVVTDRDDRIIDANSASRALLDRADIGNERLAPLLERAVAERAGALEVYRFALRSQVAEIGTAVVLTDRTEAALSERRLQLAARLEALGSLTAGIAHEINNPLAFVRANLGELAKTIAAATEPGVRAAVPQAVADALTEGEELVAEAVEGIDRIALLVTRLRGFGADPSADAAVDLLAAARTAVDLACVGLGEGAIRVFGECEHPVRTNESAVVQILVSLMLNAIQASDDEPRIEVRVESGPEGAVIHIAHEGEGIDASVVAVLSDPFATDAPTRSDGAGLGLSIAVDLARKLGGRIEAENRAGSGAIFRLHLPSAETDTSTADV